MEVPEQRQVLALNESGDPSHAASGEVQDERGTESDPIPGPMRRWMAVAMLSVGSFIFIATEFLSIGLLSDISSFYGITAGRAGLMTTVTGITAAISAPLLTRYMGRVNRKAVILVMTALLLASNLIMAFAGNFELALLSRLLLGVGLGGFWAFSVPYGVSIVQDHQTKRATTIITAGIAGGTVAGVPLGTFLGVHFGWQNAYVFMAALSAVILVAQLIALPSLKAESAIRFADMVKVVLEKSVRKRLLSTLTFATAHFTAYTYFELILVQQAGLGQDVLPTMLLLYGATGLVGTFLAEILVKRLSAKNAFQVSTVILVIAIGLMPIASSAFGIAVALTLLWGLSYGLMPVAINIWLYEANAKDYVVSTASNSSLYQVAVAIGSFVGGIVFNMSGTLPVIFLSVAIGIVCLMVSLIKTPK
ncbi:MFS transporter [Streptomyces tendae]